MGSVAYNLGFAL